MPILVARAFFVLLPVFLVLNFLTVNQRSIYILKLHLLVLVDLILDNHSVRKLIMIETCPDDVAYYKEG